MVDVLSNRFAPTKDAAFALTRNLELEAIRASVNSVSFSVVRADFNNLIDNLMKYNVLESEALL